MEYYVYLENRRTKSSAMFTTTSLASALNIARVMDLDMICTIRENKLPGYAPVIYENETVVRGFDNQREYKQKAIDEIYCQKVKEER